MIDALANSVTPAVSVNNEVRTLDNLNPDVRLILEEITFVKVKEYHQKWRKCPYAFHLHIDRTASGRSDQRRFDTAREY